MSKDGSEDRESAGSRPASASAARRRSAELARLALVVSLACSAAAVAWLAWSAQRQCQACERRVASVEAQLAELRRSLGGRAEHGVPDKPRRDSPGPPDGLSAQDFAKGDLGEAEDDVPLHVGDTGDDGVAFRSRGLLSTRRRRDRANCPKGCKGRRGEKGRKGEVGIVSYGGEKGRKGEPGAPCTCTFPTLQATVANPTTTPATMTSPRETTVPLVDDRQVTLSVAHFEGGREATIQLTREAWVPYWQYASWMDIETRSKFLLGTGGKVTVRDSGVYYLYSQMLYYDPSVFVGHAVYVGDRMVFRCTQCTVDQDRKYNTCYIGGVVKIQANHTVGIRLSYYGRTISLDPVNTHFGLIRLS